MKNLSALIREGGNLPETVQREMLALFGARCRADTRDRLARRLALPLSLWPEYGIFNRVHIEGHSVSYCAGQNYPGEVAYVRSLILKG